MERSHGQTAAPDSLNVPTAAPPIETDALILGAGPVGLFQAFELGLHDIRAHIVEALPFAGGQCAELYGDKPIYDIPGIPSCTGRELTERLLQQLAPLALTFHFNQLLSTLAACEDGRWEACTDQGTRFLARTIFIAAGVGAFLPRKLTTPGIEAFEGRQLHYRMLAPKIFAQRQVVVVGGDEAALANALRLCPSHPDGYPHKAAHVTLLHRRDTLQAPPALLAQWQAACDAGAARLEVGQIAGFDADANRLQALQVLGADAQTHTLPVEQLLVQWGLSPKLGPITQWSLAMERKQLLVDTQAFSTNASGIFAVGDIVTYPGKRKLIVCGFHEATLAAFGARTQIYPDRPDTLEYTTSSKHLHAVLGVSTPTH